MATPALQMYSCVHLLVRFTSVLPDHMFERLRAETNPDRASTRTIEWRWEAIAGDGHFLYSQSFVKLRSPRRSSQYDIELHYDLAEKPQRRADVKTSARVDQIMTLLGDLNGEASVLSEARFEYDEQTARKLFPIKSESLQEGESLFDEVRGLTVVKTENGRGIYRVALESVDLKELSLEVFFGVDMQFSGDLPNQVLEQAHLIASKFITTEPT